MDYVSNLVFYQLSNWLGLNYIGKNRHFSYFCGWYCNRRLQGVGVLLLTLKLTGIIIILMPQSCVNHLINSSNGSQPTKTTTFSRFTLTFPSQMTSSAVCRHVTSTDDSCFVCQAKSIFSVQTHKRVWALVFFILQRFVLKKTKRSTKRGTTGFNVMN